MPAPRRNSAARQLLGLNAMARVDQIDHCLGLIQAEYLEIPGLHLTRPQARRLWNLEPQVCDALLEALVAVDFLRKTPRDGFVLASSTR
jgi:hypothetical protein